MEAMAHQSRLQVRVGSKMFPVVALVGKETFSEPFVFRLTVVFAQDERLASLLGDSAELMMKSTGGFERRVNGVVSAAKQTAVSEDGQSIGELTLASRLASLQRRTDCRLIVGLTLPEIVEQTLCRHGIPQSSLHTHWSRNYPVRSATLQAQESDFDFLSRLCSQQGIFFWSESVESDELIHLADHDQDFIFLSRPPLRYRQAATPVTDGLAAASDAIVSLSLSASLTPERFIVHDVCENQPGESLEGQSLAQVAERTGPKTVDVRFGVGALHVEEAEYAARVRSQQAVRQAMELRLSSHAADLQIGCLVHIEADEYGAGISGDYLITSIEHQASQAAGLGLGGENDCPYTNTVTLIPRGTPWRSAWHGHCHLPMTFSARIESRQATPLLDESGRYRYRQVASSEVGSLGENSVFVRRLQPYVSGGRNEAAGWHTPLHDQAEVLVSCLNNDPDRPMIVGSLPNPDTPSVVNGEEPWLNRLLTAADNELCFSDRRDASAITLRTFAGQNILHLDAALAEHRLRLASEHGLVTLYAKKTQHIHSGDTFTEKVGQDRVQTAENCHATRTKNGKIHYQSARDAHLQAAAGIQLQAGSHIEARCQEDLRLDIEQSTRINVQHGNAVIRVNRGTLTVQAGQAIDIKGDGGGLITIGQNGGGFEMAPNGDVNLFGKAISFKTSGRVSLNGQVNVDVTSPPTMVLPSAREPGHVGEIQRLHALESAKIFNLAWSQARISVAEEVGACFAVRNFEGGEKVEVTVFEAKPGGEWQEVDRLFGTLPDGSGHCQLPWQREEKEVAQDLIMDEVAGDQRPLIYAFKVAINDVMSEMSPQLNLCADIQFSVEDESGHSLEDGAEVRLTDAEGQQHFSQVKKGIALFESVLLGPWQLHLETDNLIIERGDQP